MNKNVKRTKEKYVKIVTNIIYVSVSKAATHCYSCVLDKLQKDSNENQAPKACLGFLS